MQFTLSAHDVDPTRLVAALRPLDPAVQIALDAAHARLEVITSASATQVQGALQGLGWQAVPLEKDTHISGGSTCCGGCS